MIFLPGARYRHRNCLDIDIHILKVWGPGPGYTRLNVAYINRNYQDGNMVQETERNVIIKEEQYGNWKRVG